MSNLLAVDFDSFFPNPWGDPEASKRRDVMLYDWGHMETPLFKEFIWGTRAEGFLQYGLPLPDLDGREQGFWDRFKIAKGAKLFFADSNAMAVSPKLTGRARQWGEVWLYDAHHDSGYHKEDWLDMVSEGRWSCEDWMILYSAMGAKLHVRYPEWRAWALGGEPEPAVEVDRAVDDGSNPDVVFDRVFVCRSGAWVPPWLDIDARFEQFIAAAPVASDRRFDVDPATTYRRDYDQTRVEAQLKQRLEWFPDMAAQYARAAESLRT